MKESLLDLPRELFALMDSVGRQRIKDIIAEDKNVYPYCLGRSIEGREIEMFKIGQGGRRVAIFATHHALENVTSNLMYAFIYILNKGLGTNICGMDIATLLSHSTYYIVPCVNPDGVELFSHGPSCEYLKGRQASMSAGDYSLWQANARGVDLNHNYDYRFLEYKLIEREKGITPGPTLYSGEYPESEPESRAVASFVRALSPTLVISLHSQGEEIYSFGPSSKKLAMYLSKHSGYNLSSPDGTASYGGLCDYTGECGIPSLTIEVGKGRNPLHPKAALNMLDALVYPLLGVSTLL